MQNDELLLVEEKGEEKKDDNGFENEDEDGFELDETDFYGNYGLENDYKEDFELDFLQHYGSDDSDNEEYETFASGGTKWKRFWLYTKRKVYKAVSSDWVLLVLLGLSTALLSFVMDIICTDILLVRSWIIEKENVHPILKYPQWVLWQIVFVVAAVAFTNYVSRNAIGSGIPEMKTLLKGFQFKGFLSFRTLVATTVGLILTVSSGVPVGKEGPFIHIACMVAMILLRLPIFRKIRENNAQRLELFAAACAVGVSCNFGAPIGGVLFSIEVTATYFAVRNYWRGFFASVVGAFVFRLLAVWFTEEKTITAVFTTQFDKFPFDPEEMIAFIILGICCGLFGSIFVFYHAKVVELRRKMYKKIKYLDANIYVYPVLVALIISSIQFPYLIGTYMGLPQKVVIDHLFDEKPLIQSDEWNHPNVYVSLTLYFVINFIFTAIVVALPFPAGVFVPVFTMGAAFGRLVGEIMLLIFPNGVHINDEQSSIIPGGYAVVGAAAMAGAVTHTISTSVIVFELTGQMGHILPVMIAVLIANSIAQATMPSFYESIIQLKNLPYLPALKRSHKNYRKTANDIMKPIKFSVTEKSTYRDVFNILRNSNITEIPLIKSDTLALLGVIKRTTLENVMADRAMSIHISRISETNLENFQDSEDGESDRNDEIDVDSKNSNYDSETEDEQMVSLLGKSEPTPSSSSSANSLRKFKNYFKKTDSQSSINLVLQNEPLVQDATSFLDNVIELSSIQVDPAPFNVSFATPMPKIHQFFGLMNVIEIYVTKHACLVGVITLQDLAHVLKHRKVPFHNSPLNQDILNTNNTICNEEINMNVINNTTPLPSHRTTDNSSNGNNNSISISNSNSNSNGNSNGNGNGNSNSNGNGNGNGDSNSNNDNGNKDNSNGHQSVRQRRTLRFSTTSASSSLARKLSPPGSRSVSPLLVTTAETDFSRNNEDSVTLDFNINDSDDSSETNIEMNKLL